MRNPHLFSADPKLLLFHNLHVYTIKISAGIVSAGKSMENKEEGWRFVPVT